MTTPDEVQVWHKHEFISLTILAFKLACER